MISWQKVLDPPWTDTIVEIGPLDPDEFIDDDQVDQVETDEVTPD